MFSVSLSLCTWKYSLNINFSVQRSYILNVSLFFPHLLIELRQLILLIGIYSQVHLHAFWFGEQLINCCLEIPISLSCYECQGSLISQGNIYTRLSHKKYTKFAVLCTFTCIEFNGTYKKKDCRITLME